MIWGYHYFGKHPCVHSGKLTWQWNIPFFFCIDFLWGKFSWFPLPCFSRRYKHWKGSGRGVSKMFIKPLFFGNCNGDRNCSFHKFLPINSQLECENHLFGILRHFKTRGGVSFWSSHGYFCGFNGEGIVFLLRDSSTVATTFSKTYLANW